MRSGTLRDARPASRRGKVTAIEVFDGGAASAARAVRRGRDRPAVGPRRRAHRRRDRRAAGRRAATTSRRRRSRPSSSRATPADRRALHVALDQLAEQDPLIGLRQRRARSCRVSLYGEVQKEVIEATLAEEYGIDVAFERDDDDLRRAPGRHAARRSRSATPTPNPFLATVGLRVEPRRRARRRLRARGRARLDAVRVLQGGRGDRPRRRCAGGSTAGACTDCAVTMTHSRLLAAPEPLRTRAFNKSMSSTARRLPRAHAARADARRCAAPGTRRARAGAPLHARAAGRRARPGAARARAARRRCRAPDAATAPPAVLEGDVPAARCTRCAPQLPGLTRGEALLESAFDRYEPVSARRGR